MQTKEEFEPNTSSSLLNFSVKISFMKFGIWDAPSTAQ